MPLHEIALSVRRGQVSAEALVAESLGRIERLDPGLGAFAFAWIDDWIGPKRTVLICIASLCLVSAAILSLTVYVILEIEYPRRGLIRVDAADQVFLEHRKSMQ